MKTPVCTFRLLAAPLLFALASAGAPAHAQMQDSDSPIVVRGQNDPALRKAAAIVNGSVVTDLDVDQRLSLVVMASGVRIPAEELARLRAQIMRNLIDEQLQIQEAREQKIELDEGQVVEAFNRVAQNFRQSPEQFAEFLTAAGSSRTSLMQQIRAELAWSRVLRRRVEPLVAVGDEEVEAIVNRLKAAKGQDEYRLSEIFLAATTETEVEVRQRADQILEQLRAGASFVAYARQFSEAATAAVGGDRGFIAGPQLDSALRAAVETMQPGQVVGPVQVANGFYILQLIEKRKVLAANPLDATISAKQISVRFQDGATRQQNEAMIERFNQATRNVGGCGRVEDIAKGIGGDVSEIAQVRVRDLPQGLQRAILALQIGQATEPFGTQQDARVIVLCGRDDPQEQEPDPDAIYEQLNEQRVALMARRYMRDLRSDAIVDIR
jgi:peptidyl-prolyl cis-trans isomerase SurA